MDSDMNDGSLDLRVQRFVVLAGWLRQKRAQTAAVWAKWRATYNFVAQRRERFHRRSLQERRTFAWFFLKKNHFNNSRAITVAVKPL
jgi:hypothetical protein